MIMAIVSCLALLSCEKPHEDDLVQDVITDEKPAEKPEDKPETPDTSQVDQVQPDYAFVDYSYAGYRRSESAPQEGVPEGYEVYDVTDYGAVPDDGISDREAFLNTLKAALKTDYRTDGNGWIVFGHKEKANAVIYFPDGEFILHTREDDVNGKSVPIQIRSGNLIIRGAGRDKTILLMQDPNLPRDPSELYSSPEMLILKHNSGTAPLPIKAEVAEYSPKGSHSIKVSSTASLHEGQWVCLHVKNNDPDFVASHVYPYEADASWTISKDGAEVIDYHQIKSVEENTVTFHEPLMTDVKAGYGWELLEYPHYEQIGIEDLTFKGCAKPDFSHHASWEDDGGYKPLCMQRVTNSWIRRVKFESTSEACTITNSANVSVYDIIMEGNRGHSAVRSQASSRVLIAATCDHTSDGAGNFHGVGVSKHSIGTVLWRNIWGDDSCFESHANQPRATLIDCCSGGWHRGHMGGNHYEAPHHLSDLVIWSFKATDISETDFPWWDTPSWRFLPPIIAGFEGNVNFTQDQAIIIDTEGIESLFEHQLQNRLGHIPAWITELKTINQ